MWRSTCLLSMLVLLNLAAGPATQPAPPAPPMPHRLTVINGDLYDVASPVGATVLVGKNAAKSTGYPHDAVHYPPERRVCFAYLDESGEAPAVRLFDCSPEGVVRRQWQLLDAQLAGVVRVEKVQWVQEQKVFVVARIDPATQLGLEFRMYSNEHRCFIGHSFMWDRAGNQVAYLRAASDASTDLPGELFVNDHKICDIGGPGRAKLYWPKDGKTLLVWIRPPDGDLDSGRILEVDLHDAQQPKLQWGQGKPPEEDASNEK